VVFNQCRAGQYELDLSDLGSAFVGGEGRRRSFWRKRVGVEPTKDRLTAPPGFEVRTPHRGRFSSNSFHSEHLATFLRANKPSARDMIQPCCCGTMQSEPAKPPEHACVKRNRQAQSRSRERNAKRGLPSWPPLFDIGWFYRSPAEVIRGARCFGPSTTTSAPIFTRL
jgi:hypothetical protein